MDMLELKRKARIVMGMKAMGPALGVLAIAIAFAVGTYISKHSDPDSAGEQIAERVLEVYGIDHDFTPDDEPAK